MLDIALSTTCKVVISQKPVSRCLSLQNSITQSQDLCVRLNIKFQSNKKKGYFWKGLYISKLKGGASHLSLSMVIYSKKSKWLQRQRWCQMWTFLIVKVKMAMLWIAVTFKQLSRWQLASRHCLQIPWISLNNGPSSRFVEHISASCFCYAKLQTSLNVKAELYCVGTSSCEILCWIPKI